MTPVCPACRAPVRLDSFACGRCGLAMRPTCGQCSEPLTVGMTSCWRCQAAITEPSHELMAERAEPINVAAAAAAAAVENPVSPYVEAQRPEHFEPTEVSERAANESPDDTHEQDDRSPTQAMPVTEHSPFTTSERSSPARNAPADPFAVPRFRKFRPGRVLFIGLVSGLLVALGLLVAEGIWARYRYPDPSEVALTEQQFAQFDFALDIPSKWDVETEGEGASFTDPDRPDDRGIRVTLRAESLQEIRDNLDRTNRARFAAYRRLRSSDEERVGGRPAILREFVGNELQYRQWVVSRSPNRSFAIESWFHPAEGDETQIVDQRIIESFNVL